LLLLLQFAGLARLQPLDAQLDEVADRLFELRPVLGLVRGKLKAGLQGGNARIGESGNVCGAQPMTLFEARLAAETVIAAEAVLRVSKRRAGKRNERCRRNHWPQHGIPPEALLT
jgi:hypothetical protein